LDPDGNDIPNVMLLGAEKNVIHDEKDILILKTLALNVRRPVVDIAKEINESPQFVINRIKLLEKKKIIQGYKPILNWNLLGYDYYKVNLTLSNFDKINELFDFCKSNPYIAQVDKTIGGWDFEFEIFIKNKDHFNQIMNDLTKKFPDVVEGYTLFMFDNVYKTTFISV
jgi:DNA-binding Lrp family transcriptional regulator